MKKYKDTVFVYEIIKRMYTFIDSGCWLARWLAARDNYEKKLLDETSESALDSTTIESRQRRHLASTGVDNTTTRTTTTNTTNNQQEQQQYISSVSAAAPRRR